MQALFHASLSQQKGLAAKGYSTTSLEIDETGKLCQNGYQFQAEINAKIPTVKRGCWITNSKWVELHLSLLPNNTAPTSQ